MINELSKLESNIEKLSEVFASSIGIPKLKTVNVRFDREIYPIKKERE